MASCLGVILPIIPQKDPLRWSKVQLTLLKLLVGNRTGQTRMAMAQPFHKRVCVYLGMNVKLMMRNLHPGPVLRQHG